jgi:hypothetical protein
MTDPMRLRDESASALERALLEAGSAYRSSASARAKTLAALGVAGSATLLAGATQATPLAALAKITWGKLLAAISIVGAAAAVPGYYAWQRHQSAQHGGTSAVAISAKPIAPPLAPPPIAGASVGAPAMPAVGESMGVPMGIPMGIPMGLKDGPAHAARPSVTLAHELSSIDAARGMLARGDAAGALARLDAYGRAYPRGRLGLEAEVLRIDALGESGRTDAARVRAEAFLQRHPHSVLASHVRTRLGD